MKQYPSSRSQLCVLCGRRDADTRDHVPPRSIFPSPRPPNLITVPACRECNVGHSEADELFAVFLSLHLGRDQPVTASLFNERALRSTRHNHRLRTRLISQAEKVSLCTASGLLYGEAVRIPWDSRAFTNVITVTIRGLFFHHYGELLDPSYSVRVQFLRDISGAIHDMADPWPGGSVGGDQFVYRCTRAASGPQDSAWLLQFFGRFWVSGYTFLGEDPGNA